MNSKKRAAIKSDAQRLKAKVQIGAAELHDNIYDTISENFNNSEIVKIKVNRADKSDKKIVREMANKIVEHTDCEFVDVIGTTIILYKMSDDVEKRKDYDTK